MEYTYRCVLTSESEGMEESLDMGHPVVHREEPRRKTAEEIHRMTIEEFDERFDNCGDVSALFEEAEALEEAEKATYLSADEFKARRRQRLASMAANGMA